MGKNIVICCNEYGASNNTNVVKLYKLLEHNDPDLQLVFQQAWFPGSHADVDGSYEESGLSDIALQWMVAGAEKHGLLINKKAHSKYRPVPDPARVLHTPLLPFWWLLGWKRRVIPEGAWVHESVRQRVDATGGEPRPYRRPLPDKVTHVECPGAHGEEPAAAWRWTSNSSFENVSAYPSFT